MEAVSTTGLARPELSCCLPRCRVLDRWCGKKSKYSAPQGTDASKGAAFLSYPNMSPLRAADTWMDLVVRYPQSPFSGKRNVKLARRMELKKIEFFEVLGMCLCVFLIEQYPFRSLKNI